MSTGSVGPAVVALGGGHGLAATLSAVRLMSDRLTAVVTVADDGGSSGRLRDELGVLPPGDLRMALAALCDDSDWGRTWRDLLQHRFRSSGDLDQHAVGNLLIVALWEQLGDTVAGLDWVGRLLGARGRVLPMAAVPLAIEADVLAVTPGADGAAGAPVRRVVHGQSAVAITPGHIEQVRLVPPDPPACPEAVAAIEAADWVILGPGSWFTSVLPHLLVPELAAALHRTTARRCVTLNLSPEEEGETAGMTATEHLQVLHHHAPELRIDAVVADPRAVDDVAPLVDAAAAMGARLLLRQVRTGDGSPRHDPLRLAAAFRDVFDDFLGDVGTPA
ncbi:uridine diphosphate-N-acetylglucosamine-binding protein YvcK [Cellulomonas sp. ATA003]|uniref:gluconeogenesis factor YvcK family protein n=1 Tax=Cellulomonas sp. ATA003 TaxID=3073064 RepID=UPI002872CC82|nr:uridine diphosphate-N-acetylglucosamine-binding protein YvcK [Cellulomonas sp. ATA003]WNB87037.1 uridine diphosphate-N-acetylglucosamine-binding protein YvcK [Cellulomonas sp. ATA003]